MPIRAALAGLASALVLAPSASATLADADGFTLVKRDRAPKEETFAVPLHGPLQSGFGYRWGRLHSGLDIAVLGTDEVHAARSGVVVASGYLAHYSGYGNTIQIAHGHGLMTMYAHLASASVRVGQRVARGDLIAHAGCTGSCTGPHLHFEVRIGGRAVDPLPYLKGRVR